MIKRTVPLVLLALMAASAPITSAEPAPDPVMSNYQAYLQARQAGDLKAAATAGRLALDASILKDGDLGATGALATNLAYVEIGLGHEEEAIIPARQALKSAEAGAKGVDRLAAELLVGETELSTHPEGDVHALKAAIAAAENRADLEASIFPAAQALANAEGRQGRYADMLADWKLAERHAAATPGDAALLKGTALTGEGIALIAVREDRQADGKLVEALSLLAPLAPEAKDDTLLEGEAAYATALAVLKAERSRRWTENVKSPDTRISTEEQYPPFLTRPDISSLPKRCPMMFDRHPHFIYPTDSLFMLGAGAVVVRFSTDDQGMVTKARIVGAFPTDKSFIKTVESADGHWTTTRSDGGNQPCRLASHDILQTVVFMIDR